MTVRNPSTTSSSLKEVAAVLAASIGLAVVLTWPLGAHLTTLVPHDVGDPVLNTWILWWNSVTVPFTSAWWNAPAFFPATGAITFSEHLLGLSVLASPIVWISGNPLLAYNITFLLTFALSAASAYWLGLALTGRRDAAAIMGLAFCCAPYRVAQIPHLQVLASFWMPIVLLGLHRYLADGRRRWLLLFAGAWLLQALSNGYYLLYFPVLIGLWCAWFLRPRQWRRAAAIAAAFVVPVLLMLPILLRYKEVHAQYGLVRNIATIRGLSADLMSLFDASPALALWGRLQVFHRSEGELFTGVTVLAIVGAGVFVTWRRRTRGPGAGQPGEASTFLFYVAAAIAIFLFALGPSPTILGRSLGIPGPYAWLLHLPGFDSVRAPARLAMLMVLCLSIAAGLAWAALSRTRTPSRRWVVAGLCGAAIVAEGWTSPLPLWEAPSAWHIDRREISGALLVLPVLNVYNDAAAMYRAMGHGRPLVNGYSGHTPPWYAALTEGLNDRDPAILDQLAAAGVTQVAVVDRQDPGGAWREYVARRATLARQSPDGFSLFNLDHPEPVRVVSRAGLPIASIAASPDTGPTNVMTDGDLWTIWRTPGAQQGDEVVTIDLGTERPVSAVEVWLGRRTLDHPRELVIDLSDDGRAWSQAWSGRGAAIAMATAFRDPLAMPLQFPLGHRAARFVRIRQLGRHDSLRWSIAEVKVLAAPQ